MPHFRTVRFQDCPLLCGREVHTHPVFNEAGFCRWSGRGWTPQFDHGVNLHSRHDLLEAGLLFTERQTGRNLNHQKQAAADSGEETSEQFQWRRLARSLDAGRESGFCPTALACLPATLTQERISRFTSCRWSGNALACMTLKLPGTDRRLHC